MLAVALVLVAFEAPVRFTAVVFEALVFDAAVLPLLAVVLFVAALLLPAVVLAGEDALDALVSLLSIGLYVPQTLEWWCDGSRGLLK